MGFFNNISVFDLTLVYMKGLHMVAISGGVNRVIKKSTRHNTKETYYIIRGP